MKGKYWISVYGSVEEFYEPNRPIFRNWYNSKRRRFELGWLLYKHKTLLSHLPITHFSSLSPLSLSSNLSISLSGIFSRTLSQQTLLFPHLWSLRFSQPSLFLCSLDPVTLNFFSFSSSVLSTLSFFSSHTHTQQILHFCEDLWLMVISWWIFDDLCSIYCGSVIYI